MRSSMRAGGDSEACRLCGKEFRTADGLATHMGMVHDEKGVRHAFGRRPDRGEHFQAIPRPRKK